MEIVITSFLIFLAVYFGIGILFGIYFLVAGGKKMDPVLAQSKWSVRLILMPGAIALWILLLPKLLKVR